MHLTPEDMRGIGIQISRLEMCKNKRDKSTLINFFNKTEQLKKFNITSGNDNKDQRDLNCSEKVKTNSSEMLLTTELITTKNISDVLVSSESCTDPRTSFALGSAQLSELIDTSINGHLGDPPDVEAKSPISETKHKNVYNCKTKYENTKIKDASGKSNKRTVQKQMSQENFFRHIKPNSGKPSKYEVPHIQDIDMSVLIELPVDIRNEIIDECKRNKEQSQAVLNQRKMNEILYNKSLSAQNCSQIDPDVLSALMKSDLHPDVQRDVQLYCNMKNGNLKKSSEPFRTAESSTDNDSKSAANLIVNSNSTKEVTYISQAGMLQTMERCENDYIDKAKFVTHRTDYVAILHNNAATDKADNFILQNLSILHNNENIDKHQEMLINLVNHLFTLPLQQVPYI